MAQQKPKTVLFLAVTIQSLVAVAILTMAIPQYLWGPPPADEAALQAYADNAQNVVRFMVAIWASVVCVTYYFCFMRRSPGDRQQKRD